MANAAYTDTVQKVYIAYYGRAADPAGLDYWEDQLTANGGDLDAIMNAFGASDEATALFGSQENEAKINTLYNQMFGRDGDTAGVEFYLAELNAGTMTAATIAQNILDGAAGADATIITNKLAVANSYTAAIVADSATGAYANDAAITSARTLLATVTAATDTATFDVATSIATMVSTANATAAAAVAAAEAAAADAAATVTYDAAVVTHADAVTAFDAAVVTAGVSKTAADTAAATVSTVDLATASQTAAATAVTDAAAVNTAAGTVTAAAAALTTSSAATASATDDATAETNVASAATAAAAATASAATAATVQTTADAAVTTANAPAVTAALIATAADAHYAETLLLAAGTGTAGEEAVATASKLTTAEAAIADGSTQAEIDTAYDVLVADGAADIAAAASAAVNVQIVDLAVADAAVATYLATHDADTDINASDDEVSTTSAEVTTYYQSAVSAFTGQMAEVADLNAFEADIVDGTAATQLALQVAINLAAKNVAADDVNDATVAITGGDSSTGIPVTGVTGLSAALATLATANAATVAADAAAVVTQGALAGTSASAIIVANGHADVSNTDAALDDGIVTIDTDVGSVVGAIIALPLTEVIDPATGVVTLIPVDEIDEADTALKVAFIEAQQAQFVDFVTAYNADNTADIAAATALTAEQAANVSVQALDPDAALAGAIGAVATAAGVLVATIAAADGGEGDTVNTDATLTAGTIVVAADGSITATVEGVAGATVATNVDGIITPDAAFDAMDLDVSALILASQDLENADAVLLLLQQDLANTSPLADALAIADTALVDAEEVITSLSDAKVAVDAAVVINDALDAVELTASDAATALIGEFDLAANSTEFAANTVAFTTALVATDAVVISDFDVATDTIYFGDAYLLNTGATTTGDNAVLEMFITDKSELDDTAVLTFETAVYGTDIASDAAFTIELTGVTTADIAILNGMIVGA
jgi:hypothetical protein